MMNIRKFMALGISAAMILTCTACGQQASETEGVQEPAAEQIIEPAVDSAETAEPQTEEVQQEETQPLEETQTREEAQTDEASEGAAGSLPEYSYPGPELFYSVLYDYLNEEFGRFNSEGDVTIPCPVIVYMDESNNDDIRVYGNFWVYTYNLDGDILKTVSGGSYPGCIHVKSTDAGYEVTDSEIVEDGNKFTDSAKEIFGGHFDDFIKSNGDSAATEEIRAQIIANYVAANNLSITAYQDYGWDPVTLPQENIDTFYSDL